MFKFIFKPKLTKEPLEFAIARGKTKIENVHTHKSSLGGRVKFHTHPTKAWNWGVVETNSLGKSFINKLIAEFCKVDSMVGGPPFDEVAKELKVS
jgi:hypothetical protein